MREIVDDAGKIVANVYLNCVRCGASDKAEAWQIRSDHAVAIGEQWDQAAEHMRRRREAMKQQDRRRVQITGLDDKKSSSRS